MSEVQEQEKVRQEQIEEAEKVEATGSKVKVKERVKEEAFHFKLSVKSAKIPHISKSFIPRLKFLTSAFIKPSLLSLRVIKSGALNPYLSLQTLSLARPRIFPAKIPLSFAIPLRLSIPVKLPQTFRVPLIESLKVLELFAPLPKLQLKVKDISVKPLIQPEKLRELKVLKPSFNTIPLVIPHISLILIAIRKSLELVKPKLSLKVKAEKIVEEAVELKEVKRETVEEVSGIGGLGEAEFPVIPDVMLASDSEGGSLGKVSPEGPIFIVVDEELYEPISMLCPLVYRIKAEGLPSAWKEMSDDSFLREVRKQDLILVEEGFNEKRFSARIEECYKEGGFRFLIFKTPKKHIDDMVRLLKSEENKRYVPELFVYKTREFNVLEFERRKMLLSACFGFVQRNAGISFKNYPLYAHEFTKRIKKLVNNLRKELKPKYWPKSSSGPESRLHKDLKYIVISHLVQNEGIAIDLIDTEAGRGNICPDVCAGEDIAVEIETLYGRGEPAERINELIRSYLDIKFSGELRLVFPNQQALLYCDEITHLVKYYQRKLNFKVEAYTLDLTGKGFEELNIKKNAPALIRLSAVIKILQKLGIKREVRWVK